MSCTDPPGIGSSAELPTERADYRTGSDFHELLPLLYVSFLMATSTDRSIPGHPLGPFPQRQRFRQSGAVAASRTHVTPPVGRLGAVTLLTSFHNGSVSGNPVPLRQVRTHVTPPVGRLGAVTLLTSFHNGSNSLDSMPLRYRAKRKGLPDAAVARALRIPSAMAPNPGNQCHCGLSAIDQDISR